MQKVFASRVQFMFLDFRNAARHLATIRVSQHCQKFVIRKLILLRRERARVLCLQTQQGSPYIWALVDPSRNAEPRRFLLSETGQPINTGKTLSYVGTFQLEGGAVVNHLFEYHD